MMEAATNTNDWSFDWKNSLETLIQLSVEGIWQVCTLRQKQSSRQPNAKWMMLQWSALEVRQCSGLCSMQFVPLLTFTRQTKQVIEGDWSPKTEQPEVRPPVNTDPFCRIGFRSKRMWPFCEARLSLLRECIQEDWRMDLTYKIQRSDKKERISRLYQDACKYNKTRSRFGRSRMVLPL